MGSTCNSTEAGPVWPGHINCSAYTSISILKSLTHATWCQQTTRTTCCSFYAGMQISIRFQIYITFKLQNKIIHCQIYRLQRRFSIGLQNKFSGRNGDYWGKNFSYFPEKDVKTLLPGRFQCILLEFVEAICTEYPAFVFRRRVTV